MRTEENSGESISMTDAMMLIQAATPMLMDLIASSNREFSRSVRRQVKDTASREVIARFLPTLDSDPEAVSDNCAQAFASLIASRFTITP